MPPRDRMVVFRTDGKPHTYRLNQCAETSAITGDIVRVDLIREDRDLRLTFHTDPKDKDTRVRCSKPTTGKKEPLTAVASFRLAWLFGAAKIYLYANLNLETGVFSKLALGPHQSKGEGGIKRFLQAWESGKLEGPEDLLIEEDLDEEFKSDLLSRINKVSLGEADSKVRGIRCFFHPVRDQDCKTSSGKRWVPVLESIVKLKAGDDLRLWGTQAKIDEPRTAARLLQIPKSLTCGEAEPDPAKEREWYVAVQGLPHSWGEVLWNDLLSEHIRVSELDVQHGSLFTPLFSRAGSLPNLSWNVTYSVRENPGERKISEIKERSLRLSSKTANGSARVQFPLIRNHLGQPIEANVPLPFAALSNTQRLTRKEFNEGFEQALDAIHRPGIGWGGEIGSTISLFQPADPAEEQKDPRRGSVRIGAFDVSFSPVALDVGKHHFEFLWSLSSDSDRQSNPQGRFRWEEARVDFGWAVDRITPGGQDDLTGEVSVDCDEESKKRLETIPAKEERERECKLQRERPLVIPLSTKGAQELILNVRERARQRDIRRIDLTLRRPKGTKVPPPPSGKLKDLCADISQDLDRVAVLDREPFLVAKVSFPSLGNLKDPAASDEIANWQSYGHDAGAWRIRFPDAQNFCMTLPPQGVGETMEKAKTLDDKDLADFRLSPPALLSMRETYYQQNFPEAPWNLRRLLSDPGRELPGAHLTELQYELLYGLSCRIDYPFMRLAEISALVGDVMGPLPQKPRWAPRRVIDEVDQQDPKMVELYDAARTRWVDTSQRTRQRLGIFELWDIRRLDTLELKENVTCWIRQTPTGETPNDKELPSQLVPVRRAELVNPFDTTSQGLKGGVTWGFESRNVYQAVLRPSFENTEKKWPRSGGAEMRDTRFSALGGYGHQMSAFDNWRTKILADVSMGRTYSYTLERIGRIGVWWNRAKHVIIYERTVVPSAQFDADQNPLAGRAVLRKVEEYVEILQNTRKYPDSEQGNPKSAGFVTECSFSEDPNQIIRFRVKSSWGADIGTIGWKVPIWRPGEAPAFLYPKPVVNLTVLASVEGESEPRKVTIADPDNLYFFTDTTVTPEAANDPSVDLSNTDLWAPVEGVDFVDEARPQPKKDKAFESGSLQQSSSGDKVLPSGFRPCTFLIEPAEHTVDLLANRKGDPMGAALSSVTLCRAKLEEKAQGISQQFRDSMEGVEDTVRDWLAKLPGEGRVPDSIDLNQGIADLCAKASGSAKDWGKKIKEDIPGAQLGALIDEATRQALDKIDSALESMLGKAEQSDLGRALQASLEAVRQGGPDKLAERLKEAITDDVSTLGQRVEGLLPSPAVLTESVLGALQEAHRSLDEVRNRSLDFRRQVQAGISAGTNLAAVEAETQRYVEHLDQALDRLRRLGESGARIEVELGRGKKSVPFVQGAKKALEFVREKLAGIEKQLSQARDALTILRSWHDRFGEITKEARERADKLLKEATAWIDTAGNILLDLQAEIQKLDKIEEGIRQKKEDWAKALEKDLHDTVENVVANIQIPGFPSQWTKPLRDQKDSLIKLLEDEAEKLKTSHAKWYENLKLPPIEKRFEQFENLCSDLQTRLADLLAGVGKDVKVVRQFLEERRDEILRDLDEAFGEEIRTAKKILGEAEPVRQNVLNLVRAFGKPPEVSGLQFDRPEVAFFYNEIKDHVDVTPVIARAAQAGAVLEALKPFGVDLPVKELGEQLIPASLKNFDLSSILPNISGIPLQNLFSGVKMPDLSSEHVKVTHGVDVQTRRAWVNTDVNFVIPGDTKLFALGPLAVSIVEPHFKAEARMEIDIKGKQKQRVNGRLGGDWKLRIGGFELITFTQTPLEFDDSGRVRFEVDPRKVQLAEALKFINDLLSTMSPGGLSIRFDGDGVVCSLDLPLPDTQLGAFGFSGLTLATSLALRYSGGDFSIGVTAGLARRDAPFTLTIFILGGGGYLELGSRYHPSTGKIAATADMAIAVSASLAIALGPIRGGVAVYVGVTANYDSARGGGLAVGLMFMIRGHVSILSIASATITLRLDGLYQGGVLVGRGQFEIKIKICWCFTLEVSESVTYTLGRVGSGNTWMGGPQPVAQLASLGFPADFAGGAQGSQKVTKLNSDSLIAGVDAYLKMLA